MRTIFSCGLIDIWCSCEYLGQQDSLCGINQNKLQCVFMVIKKHVTQLNSGAQICVFNNFLATMELYETKGKKIYQSLIDTVHNKARLPNCEQKAMSG